MVPCGNFSAGLDNAVRVCDKQPLVAFKEMTHDRATSFVAKIANCSCSIMIVHVLIGLWTVFSWYVVKCKLFGVCVASKGAEKHVST